MPNATRFAHRFRFAGRPLPVLLLAAQGLTLPHSVPRATASDAPAPVLRVARDQPRLDAPRSPVEQREFESSRRTATGFGAVSLRAATGPAEEQPRASVESGAGAAADDAASAAVSTTSRQDVPATAGGWVTRGALRPGLPAAVSTPAPSTMPDEPIGSALASPSSPSPARGLTPPQTAPSGAESRSSNTRSLALQAQIEQNEAIDTDAEDPAGGEPEALVEERPADAATGEDLRFVEIIPESLSTSPDSQPGDALKSANTNPAEPSNLSEASVPMDEPSPVDESLPTGDQTTGALATDEWDASDLDTGGAAEDVSAEPSADNEPALENIAPQRRAMNGSGSRGIPLRDPVPGEPQESAAPQRSTAAQRQLQSREVQSPENSQRELSPPASGRRSAPAPVISAASLRLQRPIEQCLQYYHQRPEDSRERTPWGMLHAILPYNLDAMVSVGNRRYNAIAFLAGNNACRNLKLLTVNPSGRIEAQTGIGLQGHQAQLLAILAQVGVPQEYPLYAGGQRFTVADLVATEMAACRAGEELTFTLIGLAHYLPTDTVWTASDGQRWDFEKLIREELQQPVVGAACGGTHRLMGLSYVLNQRRREGLPETGQWERAAIFIDDFAAYAWQLQNRDGSFSTQWFEGREDNQQIDRKVQTTGHILEWLVFNATDEELQDERVVRSVTFLADAMLSGRDSEWQVGPKGHALRALSSYYRRVFDNPTPWRAQRTAAAPQSGRR